MKMISYKKKRDIRIRQYSSECIKYTEIWYRTEMKYFEQMHRTLWHFSSSFNALDILYILCIVYILREACFFFFFFLLASGAFNFATNETWSLAEFIRLENFYRKFSSSPSLTGRWISSRGHRDYRDGNSTVKKRLSRDDESLQRKGEEMKRRWEKPKNLAFERVK